MIVATPQRLDLTDALALEVSGYQALLELLRAEQNALKVADPDALAQVAQAKLKQVYNLQDVGAARAQAMRDAAPAVKTADSGCQARRERTTAGSARPLADAGYAGIGSAAHERAESPSRVGAAAARRSCHGGPVGRRRSRRNLRRRRTHATQRVHRAKSLPSKSARAFAPGFAAVAFNAEGTRRARSPLAHAAGDSLSCSQYRTRSPSLVINSA